MILFLKKISKPRRSKLIKIIKSFNNSLQSKLKRLKRLKKLKSDKKNVNSVSKRLRKSNGLRTSKNQLSQLIYSFKMMLQQLLKLQKVLKSKFLGKQSQRRSPKLMWRIMRWLLLQTVGAARYGPLHVFVINFYAYLIPYILFNAIHQEFIIFYYYMVL